MRLAKLILNLLQLVFVYIIITAVTFSTYTFVAFQADDESARFTITNQDDRVWMLDNFSYWGSDIGSSFENTQLPQPKLRVSLWFSWSWWQTSMSKVDTYFVNPIVSVVKPVLTPITCADEIKIYYQKDLTDFSDYVNANYTRANEFVTLMHKYYGLQLTAIGNPEDGKYISDSDLAQASAVIDLYGMCDVDFDGNGHKDIFDLADDYNYFYQLLYKLNRYNRTSVNYITEENPEGYVYYKWHKKFIIEQADGGRSLSTAVYALYTLNYVNIILALAYAWANPIRLKRDDDGALVPGTSVFSRFKREKRKDKKRHKKHKRDAE